MRICPQNLWRNQSLKRKKNLFAALCWALCLVLLLAPLGAWAQGLTEEKITVVCTLFPQYDFVRQLAGDRAEVRLLLPPGAESHNYEPTPKDMIEIQNADMFVYTGSQMEPWAERILEGIDTSSVSVVDGSKGIELIASDHDHDHDHAEEGGDPHFWLDLTRAAQMLDNVRAGLVEADPEGQALYDQRAKEYTDKLIALDAQIAEVAKGGVRDEIVFGGRFAFSYFVKRYHLHYLAAYDSCSTDVEPSVRVLAQLIEEIKSKGIPVVYYEELVDSKVAQSIADQTGAKLVLFSAAHNVTPQQLEEGVTFLSLMEDNKEALREGLY